MSKICIVFDRLRLEEKLLQKEAEDLGNETSVLDAKITQINTDSKKSDFDFGDVVLERCVSYFRGLHFTACLEFLDVPVINEFDVANNCGNKLSKSPQEEIPEIKEPKIIIKEIPQENSNKSQVDMILFNNEYIPKAEIYET